MLKSIALAAATAALVIGSIAVAQTAATDTNGSATTPNAAISSGADQNANDTATTGAGGAANTAGERG